MKNRIEELITQLRNLHPYPERTLAALRVPPGCYELDAVAIACEPALTQLCDYFNSTAFIDARDVIRGIIRLLREHADLSRNDFNSIESVPASLDSAYRALPLQEPFEPWWQGTLREALLAHLLVSPNITNIESLGKALRHPPSVFFTPPKQQKSPMLRMLILSDYLDLKENKATRLITALRDSAALLKNLASLRTETLHFENEEALAALRIAEAKPASTPTPNEQLSRIVRDIGVAAVAQRRDYHTPVVQRLPVLEMQSELLRRSLRWNSAEQTALLATFLLGRLGTNILQSKNQDPNCRIECLQHNAWISRILPESPEFSRQLQGTGLAPVSRQLALPLPRRIGHPLAALSSSGEGIQALQIIQGRMRELHREKGHPISIRRVSRIFEHELECEPPDEALMTLIGLQPQARRDAGIHYFSPDSTAVTNRFQRAIERAATRFGLDILDDGWSSPPSAPSPYFGYSYRADVGAIYSLVKSLQVLAELGRGRTNRQRMIEAYNARVARLTLMFLAGTGGRPTGTVLPIKADVSFPDRAAIAAEKDALSYRSTRLVPLPTRFITEMVEFERWADSKHLLPKHRSDDTPLAMLRTSDGNFTIPTIKALKAIVPRFAEMWRWPDDMFRHLFRSRLWEMGCPSSWLRRVMGHHPPHSATDMPWVARPQWHGLHDWTDLIDEHLCTIGF